MLMQGTSLTKQERECKLYDAFDKFSYRKGESLRDFYLRFSLLLNDMNMYNMKLEQFQYHPPQYASQAPSSSNLSISYPPNNIQSSVNHNVYMASSSIPQMEYAPTVHQLSEFSSPETRLVVPIFQKGDDPIDAINHMMSFLTTVVTSSLQEKVLVITALKESLSKLKGKDVVNEAVPLHSIDPELLKIDVAPLAPKLRKNRTAHTDYISHTLEAATLREIVESERLINPLNTSLDYANRTEFVNQTLLDYYEEVGISLETSVARSPQQNGVVERRVNLLSSASGSKSQDNSKNDRIPRTPRKAKKNKLEEHLRKVRSSLNKKSVVDTKATSSVTNSMSNVNSNLKCPSCNGCLFFDNHDACVVAYINSMNASIKSKSVKNPVYYVEGLGHNLFSVGQFCDSDLKVAFRQHTCFIRNLDGVDLLTGSRRNNLYTLSLQDMMTSSPVCLLSKASKTKFWLWHRRLSHLNFGAINHLARQGFVRGLPKLKFEKTTFVRSKDEALDFIIKFLRMIQVRLKVLIRRIRTDNGTEFVNQTLHNYYEEVGISHETSVARSPQQKGVIERRNRTLIEAARTMHTRRIVETIHVDFDELTAMASEHSSSGPALNEITHATIIIPQVQADSTGSPSSTAVDQDAPSSKVEKDNLDIEVAHMGNDPLIGASIPEVTSSQSSST
nr:integrase, catalytic region, zinc finger, CCHC-type, peptidase aspartic, catalytic [Tanacetum cinerariifolium]